MSTHHEIVKTVSLMASMKDLLESKDVLSEQEQTLLYICNESFKSFPLLTSVFTKYVKEYEELQKNQPNTSQSEPENRRQYSASEALAFGAALHGSNVFGDGNRNDEINVSPIDIPPPIEEAQIEEFTDIMNSLDLDFDSN